MPNIDVNIDNFIDHREVSLVGRDNGKACLKKISSSGINFQKLEKTNDKIIIIFPNRIVTMNRSFFLGLLADRLVELGEENFRNKYNFQASDHLNHKIDGFIKTGILEATQKQILNG